MTPVRCIAPAGEQGDCWRACIASVLNLPAREVPNFAHLSGDDWDRMYELGREWLAKQGYGLFRTYCSAGWALDKLLKCFSADNPDVPIIITGQCRVDPTDNHAVIAMNGTIAHDPSGAGLGGPWRCNCGAPDCDVSYWWLDVIALAAGAKLP